MNCPSCQSAIADTATFCPFCGAVTGEARPAPMPARPMLQPAAPPPVQAAAPAAPTAAYAPPQFGNYPAAPAAGQPAAVPAPRAAPAARSGKTRADAVCGMVFILLGAVLLVLYGSLLTADIAPAVRAVTEADRFGGIAGLFSTAEGRAEGLFYLILMLTAALAVVAGLLLLAGGVISLRSGRGKKAAYTSVTFAMFSFLFGLAAPLLAVADILSLGTAAAALTQPVSFEGEFVLVVSYFLLITPVLAAALAVTVLLFVKRAAKKRLLRETAQQTRQAQIQ